MLLKLFFMSVLVMQLTDGKVSPPAAQLAQDLGKLMIASYVVKVQS